jgi:hypothetical protein
MQAAVTREGRAAIGVRADAASMAISSCVGGTQFPLTSPSSMLDGSSAVQMLGDRLGERDL